ncbi:MAG: hypothetical protein VB081_00800 [Christensenella sp.]|uniref:hypothetical protein n=1 Tax=Christensenella sp. TaxID=1935934 RepID=UPI002B214A37|nr:hypothetical protein [Christensenella sp.]MEA5002028.1 hypothetical protein [Christensenella sp.]
MSKLFMYGTRLQEFEQMMMLVPNFTKRGKGLIILKGFPFNKEETTCRFCTEYPKCKNDESKCLVISERLKANSVCYESIVKNTFKDFREYNLKKRLSKLILEFNGDFFCDSCHRQRFENIINIKNRVVKKIDYQFLATLFLLTADHELWEWSNPHIYLTKVDFKSIHLKGIDTNRYAVYQTAKTISTGKEYIKLNEIADESLIDEKTFQAIVHAILLAKYGQEVLSIANKKSL